ncbi:MAG: metal-dependent transcriptional regulator [Bacteroidetes bacterium]|nr:metal-dependent transcriptional regulator [Bacteroidota bacterium]
MHSNTEENYLKAIYKLAELNDHLAVSTNSIANQVKTKAASVSDMLKRLHNKKLINYEKYKGVTLSAKGKKEALHIIRKHRLWELFLVEKLSFAWDEVHEVAEQLEHIHSDELVDKLDKFLGYPKFDPHGDPIPDKNGIMHTRKTKLLSEIKTNIKCVVTGVIDHTSTFLKYLDKIKIKIGDEIKVTEINEYDNSLHIILKKQNSLYISNTIAKNIIVELE